MNNNQINHYKEIQLEIFDLCDRKSKDYSDHTEPGQDNISILGIKGVYVRMTDKMARLHKMVWLGQEAVISNEGIEDALKDLANYCIIALMLIRKQWKEK